MHDSDRFPCWADARPSWRALIPYVCAVLGVVGIVLISLYGWPL